MKIIFATLVLPHDQTTGGEIASQAFVDAMRACGHRVEVFGFTRIPASVPTGSVVVEIRAIESAAAGWRGGLWLARSWMTNRAYVVQKFCSARYITALRAATADQKADVLVIDHAKMGWLLPFAPLVAKSVILVAHNHEAALYAAEAQSTGNYLRRAILHRESRLMTAIERRLANRVDRIWTLSPADTLSFAEMTGTNNVSNMPLPARANTAPRVQSTPLFDIGLLGTWAWDVNGRGLDWFVKSVLPILPDHITVQVAGRGSERVNGVAKNIIGLGFIEDAAAFRRSARVLAVPTIGGSGIGLKTIEAIAAGIATVSTSAGVRGISDLPDYVYVADTPGDFAEALLCQLKRPAPHPDVGQSWSKRRQSLFKNAVHRDLALLNPSAQPSPRIAAEAYP